MGKSICTHFANTKSDGGLNGTWMDDGLMDEDDDVYVGEFEHVDDELSFDPDDLDDMSLADLKVSSRNKKISVFHSLLIYWY